MTNDLDKSLKDYEPIFDRPAPVRYDVLHFNDDHRRLDALMRRHYNSFHPLIKDIFTSFSLEFATLIEQVNEMEKETNQIKEDLEEKEKNLENDLDDRVHELKQENQKLHEIIKNKDNKITDLESKIEEFEYQIKKKDALIVTQRDHLDRYIDKETKLERANKEQEETISQSIQSVSQFTNELEKIEEEMDNVRSDRNAIKQEKETLETQLTQMETQYTEEIEQISELYNQLKTEFQQVTETVNSLKQERDELKDKLNQTLNSVDYSEDIENLKNKNTQLQENLEHLRLELDNKKQELNSVYEKNEQFKEIASKLLKFKDKLEKQDRHQDIKSKGENEKIVFHPSDRVDKTKKWRKRKSRLEAELEGKVEESHQEQKYTDEMALTDVDAELDESLNLIGSKIKQLDEGKDELIDDWRNKPSQDKSDNQKVQENTIVDDSLDESILQKDALEDLSKSENFNKVINRLEGKDTDTLSKFVKDFPKPPEEEEKQKETERESLQN